MNEPAGNKQCVAEIPIEAGALIRSRVRTALEFVKDYYRDSVEISYYEDKRFLVSGFMVIMRGRYRDVTIASDHLRNMCKV